MCVCSQHILVGHTITYDSTLSTFLTSEQLNKIDEDIKKLLNDKLTILRGMQGGMGENTLRRRAVEEEGEGEDSTKVDDPKSLVAIALTQGTLYSHCIYMYMCY